MILNILIRMLMIKKVKAHRLERNAFPSVIFSFFQIYGRPCQPRPQPQQRGKAKQYNHVSLHSLHSLWTLDSLEYQLSIYSKTHISHQYYYGSSWNFQRKPTVGKQTQIEHETSPSLTYPKWSWPVKAIATQLKQTLLNLHNFPKSWGIFAKFSLKAVGKHTWTEHQLHLMWPTPSDYEKSRP